MTDPGPSSARPTDAAKTPDGRPRPGERRPGSQTLLDRLRSLFGLGAASIRDDIEDALEETDADGVFSPQERAMLRNVLGLHEIRVDDIMVPRADIIAVSVTMTLADVLAVFRDAGHSRLPVHGDTLDDPRGMIHIRDFVDVLAAPAEAHGPQSFGADLAATVAQANVMRSVLFVPPSMKAIDLLVKMQASRTHMAIVIDEYGGTDGLVSIEDIVEMIVGDIEDEHDETELPLIETGQDGSYLADGRADLEEVSRVLGIDMSDDESEEIDTIGGLVTSIAGRVPNRGEIVAERPGIEFEILDADPRRVKRVRIRLRSSVESRPEADADQDPPDRESAAPHLPTSRTGSA